MSNSNAITSTLAILSFVTSLGLAYIVYRGQNTSPPPLPIAVVDYFELGKYVSKSQTPKEEALKLELISAQIDALGEAGYLVFDQRGSVLHTPEAMRVTAEVIGLK